MSRIYLAVVILITLADFAATEALASESAKTAFVFGANVDFKSEIDPLVPALSGRGWAVNKRIDVAGQKQMDGWLQELKDAIDNGKEGDRILVSLECHGATIKVYGGEDHICCMNTKCSVSLKSSTLKEYARKASERKLKLVVMDNSCEGGETVKLLDGIPGVCAMSTTTHAMPALTAAPAFSKYIADTKVTNFEELGKQGTLEVIKRLAGRPYQRTYQNGCRARTMGYREQYSNALLLMSTEDNAFRATPLTPYLDLGSKDEVKSWKNANGWIRKTSDRTDVLCQYFGEFEAEWANSLKDLNAHLHMAAWQDEFNRCLPETVATYRKWGIPFPDSVHDYKSAVAELQNRAGFLRERVSRYSSIIDTLNTEVERYEKEPQAVRAQVISELASDARSIQKEIAAERNRMSAVMNVIEEFECAREPSSCRAISL